MSTKPKPMDKPDVTDPSKAAKADDKSKVKNLQQKANPTKPQVVRGKNVNRP